jgi:hypothetical protein
MYSSYTLIYHSIPSYDGVCEYMSGYQVGRIPDVIRATLANPDALSRALQADGARNQIVPHSRYHHDTVTEHSTNENKIDPQATKQDRDIHLKLKDFAQNNKAS